jgi:hypothetical protein
MRLCTKTNVRARGSFSGAVPLLCNRMKYGKRVRHFTPALPVLRKLRALDKQYEWCCVEALLVVQLVGSGALLLGHLTVVVWNRLNSQAA